jgi:two-component system cell cycle response regulator
MKEMHDRPIQLLLIEDNAGDRGLIREALGSVEHTRFELTYADRLSTGLAQLARGSIDIVLLDLSLPDSQGLETLEKTHAQVPDVPIVVLTELEDEALAIKSVQAGAQDYLVKGQTNGQSLTRSLRHAIERQRLQEELRALSLEDSLTGLRNRRGFVTLAAQGLKTAHRTKHGMFLLYLDLDGLKQINDTLGHSGGDAALLETAHLLQETFRESDILARVGGDEFAVLAVEMAEDRADILTARLQRELAAHNARANRAYQLSLSVGITRYDPDSPCTIDELLARADGLMYEEKRRRKP